MSKRKKPTPPGFIAASKQTPSEVSRPVAPPSVVKPRHRLRDEKSLVTPGEALKAARESRSNSTVDRVETPEQAKKRVSTANVRPVVPPTLKRQQLDVVTEPVRRSAATRYDEVEAVTFKETEKPAPSRVVRKSIISDDLRNAILSDTPHPSEFVAQETYDVESPLPKLLASDFEDEGIPEFFIELDDNGQHVENTLFLPPVSVGEEPYGAAGVIHDDRVYDVELASSELIEAPETVIEPVDVVPASDYRSSYLSSVHAEEFFDEIFVDESDVSGEPVIKFGNELNSSVPVEPVPLVSSGQVTVNEGWAKLSLMYSAIPASLIALVTVLITVFRGESWIIPLIVGGVGVIGSAVWLVSRISRFKKFVLDFDSMNVVVGGKTVPFSEVWEGQVVVSEKFGMFPLRELRFDVDGVGVRALISSSSWGLPVLEGDALVDFVHHSSFKSAASSNVGEVGSRAASQEEVLSLVASTRMGLE